MCLMSHEHKEEEEEEEEEEGSRWGLPSSSSQFWRETTCCPAQLGFLILCLEGDKTLRGAYES